MKRWIATALLAGATLANAQTTAPAAPTLQTGEIGKPQTSSLAFRISQREGFNLEASGQFLVFLDYPDEPFTAGFDHLNAGANYAVQRHTIHRSSPLEAMVNADFYDRHRTAFNNKRCT